ncbi:hypothetical protein CVT26_011676 [Gymnopilus dilepis]|uniref:BHLH domain-containing protein n=1 Tax=Gymnopilus dilepis TaxID=231916 RepID=A0A409WC62_9AGAR|nr:hypothetical protein CVT26_011676 [Gymnopilus dilepis]
MAMTLPLSPASDAPQPASPSTTTPTGNAAGPANSSGAAPSNTNDTNSNNSNNNNNNASEGSSGASGSAATGGAAGVKRKTSRRANTAERRATHNAVERQRRETLNGRFLDLAQLLPNLSQIRRPSKSSIVNSSIAHIHASRRHRVLAQTQLRALKNEADALRREVNEWRDRAGIPRIEEPVRGEAFSMVLSGELELVSVIGEEEDGEDGVGADEDGFGATGQFMDGVDDNDMMPMSAGGYPPQQHMPHPHHVAMHPQMQHHMQQQHHAQQMYGAHHGHPGHHMEDLDDPRIAAMMMKNGAPGGQNPFAHNLPPQYHQQQQRADYFGGYRQGNGAGFGPHPSQGPYNSQGQVHGQHHLFTPPATAHGLPPAMNRPSTSSAHSTGSHTGSPSPVADGMSPNLSLNTSSLNGPANGSVHGSPVSTSSMDNGLAVPPNTAVSPIGLSGAAAFEGRGSVSPSQTQVKPIPGQGPGRGRSGSVLSVGSGPGSPAYELAHGYDVGMSVPRRMEGGGGYMMNGMGMGGMNGMSAMNGGMHPGYGGHGGHHGGMQHGMGGGNTMSGMGANMMGVGVGGGNNGNAMMMMMM